MAPTRPLVMQQARGRAGRWTCVCIAFDWPCGDAGAVAPAWGCGRRSVQVSPSPQVEACHRIMGVPESDTAVMIGGGAPCECGTCGVTSVSDDRRRRALRVWHVWCHVCE